ncbi:MAG: hypothetical protein OXC68_08090 [Aestuariivita sp.]|nr:hypothetical protein [Aestuariivita sp.]
MDENPDPYHEFDKRLAVLEERMKTLKPGPFNEPLIIPEQHQKVEYV